jgi:hypothetical protein
VAFPTFISKLLCCTTHDVDFLCGDGIEDKLVVWNEENISHFLHHFFWRAKASSCVDANLSNLQ